MVAVTSVVAAPAPKKAEAASYKAYLCFQTEKFQYRNTHDDAAFASTPMDQSGEKLAGTFKDVSFKKGKLNFTVKVTGLKKGQLEGGWNTLFVDTTLPGKNKSKLKVTNVTVKMDGKVVKKIKNPTITPDPGASAPGSNPPPGR